MGLQYYTQDMSKIPLKYHKRVLFYTKYTHPTLICGTHGRTDAWRENIYSIFRDKLLLLGEHGQFISGGYSPVPKVALFLWLSNLHGSAPWAFTNIFNKHKVALFLCLLNLHRFAPWIFTNILRIQLSSSLSQLLTTLLKWTTSMVSQHLFEK